MDHLSHGHILLYTSVQSLVCFYSLSDIFPETTLTKTFTVFALINWGLWLLWSVFVYPFFFSPLRHLSKPRTWGFPLLGHAHLMFSRPPGHAYLNMLNTTPNDGLIHFRSILHADRLLLTSPAAIADILVHKSYDFEKPAWARNFLRQFLGDGMLMTEGDEHRFQRKMIMPAFQFRHIKELYPIFWRKSMELCQTVSAELASKSGNANKRDSNVVEMSHFSTQVTMDIIGLAGIGRDIQSLKNSDDLLVKNYEEILEPTTEKAVYFILHTFLPQWFIQLLPWNINQRVKVTTGNLKMICRDFVQEKRLRMKSEDLSEEKKDVDILSILIRSNSFSDDGLVDQLLTFLAAGHETTSSAFTWATHLLATHPKIQARLRTEIHSNIAWPTALSSSSVDEISTLLESLPLLNAVCNETLRLFPTIPITSRVASRPTTILNHPIPQGTVSFVVPWAINRAPSLWGPDAASFNPDRWIDKQTGKANYVGSATSNYSFLTFLHGPRSCIGERFARSELRALVAAFVGSFAFEMSDPKEVVVPAGTITSKPRDGMRLRLRSVGWG